MRNKHYLQALKDVEELGEKLNFGLNSGEEKEEFFVIKWSEFQKLKDDN